MSSRSRALAQFTSQLAMLEGARLPLVRSLRLLERPMAPGALRSALTRVITDVESGASFSDALAAHPGVFDPLYVGAARSGEAIGALGRSLSRLAAHLARGERLRRRVGGALIYPALQLAVASAILIGFSVQLVPAFEPIFADLGVDLPWLTELVLGVTDVVTRSWALLVALPLLAIVCYRLVAATSLGRWTLDALALRLPVVGRLVRRSAIGGYCRALGTMIDAGVPLLDALAICRDQARNTLVRYAGGCVLEAVADGETLSAPLARSGVADEMTIRLIEIGEESGALGEMLIQVADGCDADVGASLDGIASLLQPLMIVAIGCVMCGVVVAMYLPLIAVLE